MKLIAKKLLTYLKELDEGLEIFAITDAGEATQEYGSSVHDITAFYNRGYSPEFLIKNKGVAIDFDLKHLFNLIGVVLSGKDLQTFNEMLENVVALMDEDIKFQELSREEYEKLITTL